MRYSNQTHVSRSDPDARLYRKSNGQSATLSYLVHDVIDTRSRVILGRRASRASSRAEREVTLELLQEHEARRKRLGLAQHVEIVTADKGYGTREFVAELLDQGITPHIPIRAKDPDAPVPTWKRRTFNLRSYRKRREAQRLARARLTARALQQGHGYQVSRKLRVRSEHLFAEAKNEHGLDQTRYRGVDRVDRQCVLIAAVQNLKRLVERRPRRGAAGAARLARLAWLRRLLTSTTRTLMPTTELAR